MPLLKNLYESDVFARPCPPLAIKDEYIKGIGKTENIIMYIIHFA